MRLMIALLALALMAGCGDDDGAAASSSSLEGVPWQLVSGLDVEGWEAVTPTVSFEGTSVTGSSGCNQFGGKFTFDGEALTIKSLSSTLMGCEPQVAAVETAYTAALERVAKWRVENEQLVLADTDGKELLRYRAASPIGTWEATSLLKGDGVRSLVAGSEITAVFADDGKLSGSAGCNTYTTTFKRDRGALTIAPPEATELACAEPIMDQERAYLEALPKTASYRVEGSKLLLLTAAGTFVATFSR
jgi:heat shock protein HslJ